MNRNNAKEGAVEKELRQIKHLLMILLFKLGATSDELNIALKMGAANIRRQFSVKKIRKITQA
jgi:hypothetical protein